MPPEEARRQAVLKFGAVEAMKADYREQRYLSVLEHLSQDIRDALRGLRKNSGFAAAAVLILALGIGATTAIFSVVNSVLIKPLPYEDSDALVRIVHSIGKEQPYFSDAIYWAYVRNTQTLQDVGVWVPATTATITGQGDPEQVRTLTATRGLLTTLGVQANADSGRILRLWLTDSGQTDPAFQARYQPALRSLKQDVVGDIHSMLWVLMGAIFIVLLLACANVANLLLVRTDARSQEFAIRAALGASWSVVARQLLVESLTVALFGGALGVVLAYGSLRVLVALGPPSLPRLSEVSIDPLVLGFALTISLVSGLLFGLMPILKHGRPQLVQAIACGRSFGTTIERQRSQHVLVVAQVTLALVLLVECGPDDP